MQLKITRHMQNQEKKINQQEQKWKLFKTALLIIFKIKEHENYRDKMESKKETDGQKEQMRLEEVKKCHSRDKKFHWIGLWAN